MFRLCGVLLALMPIASAAGPDYADELRDMKSAMEAVRADTEDAWRPQRARKGALQKQAAPVSTENSKRASLLLEALRPGALDKKLLGAADRVKEDMAATLGEVPSWERTRPKRAALAAESHLQESGQMRAARCSRRRATAAASAATPWRRGAAARGTGAPSRLHRPAAMNDWLPRVPAGRSPGLAGGLARAVRRQILALPAPFTSAMQALGEVQRVLKVEGSYLLAISSAGESEAQLLPLLALPHLSMNVQRTPDLGGYFLFVCTKLEEMAPDMYSAKFSEAKVWAEDRDREHQAREWAEVEAVGQ
ncbi:unnamed protein product [Prorocentrum cordatum]|uniref:Uncharacterized protein n=1 Tax=Prorocentrum cordatum TaxID=2364126 RepID=A0ABN9S969_9DINO|nr:unnamed protein product [Polarella glacialis]